MGINRIRKRLSRQCKGHVLEVSCGTGRNLGYYDLAPGSEIDSITFLDLSAQMVEACKRKWASLYPASSTTAADFKQGLAIRFSTTSAVGPMPPAPESTNGNGKYTTILQTMGLCSTPHPHALLLNLSSHLDHSNPDSRILLLEHGRSSHAWLNNILDNSAAKHAEIHGCWYNRDMGELVAQAAEQSGLELVESGCWRKHLGTTWVFELRPGGKSGKGVVGVGDDDGVKKVDGAVSSSSSSSSSEVAVAPGAEGWKGWFGLK
jgi:methyltransferase OMS1